MGRRKCSPGAYRTRNSDHRNRSLFGIPSERSCHHLAGEMGWQQAPHWSLTL